MKEDKPVTNPALLEAIRTMKQSNDPADIQQMIDQVLKAHFLSPVEMQIEEGIVTKQSKTQTSFFTLHAENGDHYLMAFSDWEEAHRWKSEGIEQSVMMSFDDYAAMILKEGSELAGFVINPFGDNIPFQKELIASLKEHAPTQMIQEPMRFVEPKEYPQEMMDAICAYLKTEAGVFAAYLQLMQHGEQESWAVVVDSDGALEPVVQGIAQAARPFLQGRTFHVLFIDALEAQTFAHIEPFYKVSGYIKSVLSVAIIEEIFALKKGGCVVGCYIAQGAFHDGDDVEVIDAAGNVAFVCRIDGMENKDGRRTEVHADHEFGARAGIVIRTHQKEEFIPGYQLRKSNR